MKATFLSLSALFLAHVQLSELSKIKVETIIQLRAICEADPDRCFMCGHGGGCNGEFQKLCGGAYLTCETMAHRMKYCINKAAEEVEGKRKRGRIRAKARAKVRAARHIEQTELEASLSNSETRIKRDDGTSRNTDQKRSDSDNSGSQSESDEKGEKSDDKEEEKEENSKESNSDEKESEEDQCDPEKFTEDANDELEANDEVDTFGERESDSRMGQGSASEMFG